LSQAWRLEFVREKESSMRGNISMRVSGMETEICEGERIIDEREYINESLRHGD